MNQSAILAASILAAFGLFVTSRERLPVYARVLWGDKPASHSDQAEPESEQEESQDWFPDYAPGGILEDWLDGDLKLPEIPDFNWNVLQ